MKTVFHGAPEDKKKSICVNTTDSDYSENAISRTAEVEEDIKSLFEMHTATTTDLKRSYYQQRFKLQKSQTAHGILTIKVHYCPKSGSLMVNVLNAKNLKSYDSDGKCSSLEFYLNFGV